MTSPSHPALSAPIGQRIDESYGELSPKEQRAADFILDHLADLAVYNGSELARLSGVSKATVSRLFRRLGFSDANDVRDHARSLRGLGVPLGEMGLTTPARDDRRSPAAAAPASPAVAAPLDAAQRHLDHEIANLRHALASTADGRLGEAAALLAHARRVVVVGLRNSYPIALHLREQLMQGLDDVRLAPQPGQSLGEELALLTSRDAVVLIGFRRRPSLFPRLVDALQRTGVPFVLLSDASAERFSSAAAVWFDCPVGSVTALDSYAAANSLVSVLASEALGVAARPSRTRISAINRLYGELGELEPPYAPSSFG